MKPTQNLLLFILQVVHMLEQAGSDNYILR